MTNARFPRARRLTSTADFERVYALQERAGDTHLLIFAAPNPVGTTRIGLSVSRRHGNSVVRHRIKRLLREAYRMIQHELPEGVDLVLVPRAGVDSNVEDYCESLKSLVPRLARRLKRRAEAPVASPPPAGAAP
ncbi:MAG: ribonuclease P protein component [Planctomycetaceae bacterium]